MDNYSHFFDYLVYTAVNVPGVGSCRSDFECQLSGCDCKNNECYDSCLCASRFGRNYSDGLLLDEKFDNRSVTECNDSCTCDGSCPNRVVQKGPRKFLEIFNCGGAKGLGLRTQRRILKGAFICEYAGEVISMSEARKRYQVASKKDEMNYVFVLRESTPTSVVETVVDPTMIGNIGRYINHSCDPNAAIIPVRVDCAVPKLAIFAVRNIAAGEEISFDYGGTSSLESGTTDSPSRKLCFCGADTCSIFLPFDKSLI